MDAHVYTGGMGKLVLYIEDEAFFGKIISQELTTHGFQTDLVSDGEQGITALKEKKYDVILLDLVLPKVDGFDVLRALSSIKHNSQTPVIILSNLSSEEDEKTAKELGARAFRVKMDTTPAKILALISGIV